MRRAEHGGWGALQIVGKYNVLDLSDAAFNAAGGCRNTQLYPAVAASSSVTLVAPSVGLCGEMKTWTVGMKWYLNDYVRLMFDYSESDLGDYPVEEARGVELANGSDLERALALLITRRRLEDRSFTAALEKK